MTEQKHTALPWMAATAYSSVCGVPIVNQEDRRVANTALPDMPKEWDELKRQAVIDAAFICKAVNTYPAVVDLVEALELARKRIEYLGNFGHERHQKSNETEFFPLIDSVINRFRSLEAGKGGVG